MFYKQKYVKLFFNVLGSLRFYLRARKALKRNRLKTKPEIEEYQFNKIRELITHAYNTVPYYRESFDKAGFRPEDFKSMADMVKLPVTSKDTIRKYREQMISTTFPESYLKEVKSGGTTGLPVSFYLDARNSSPVEMAYLQDIWGQVGFRLFDRVVVLRGETFEKEGDKHVYWHKNHFMNWLSMSTYHLRHDTYPVYYKKLHQFKPKFIIAYPSIMMTLTHLLKENNQRLPASVQAVICSSESLFASHKKFMEKRLEIPVTTYYGLSEKCCIAKQCLNSNAYQFYPQYGYVELLDENNKVVTTEGKQGEITATSLNNFAFPFIRYKTGDIGTLGSDCKNDDSNWFSLAQIEGRKQDYLIDKNGNRLPFAHADEPIWFVYEKVDAYQYIQEAPGVVTLNLVKTKEFTPKDIEEINKSFYRGYKNIQLELNFVDQIERTVSGKFRYLLQKTKV